MILEQPCLKAEWIESQISIIEQLKKVKKKLDISLLRLRCKIFDIVMILEQPCLKAEWIESQISIIEQSNVEG
jgi:hypothetical protein